ncbi:MAG: riboflavin synthase, partial [Limnohabitans sp.]
NLGQRRVGDFVNLERALTYGGRMGGHYVQGHVDGVAHITAIRAEGESKFITITPPAQLLPYIVMKGYIAIDGVSLTVNRVHDQPDGCEVSINLIPHTVDHTSLGSLQAGSAVNLEIDTVARYVERMLSSSVLTEKALT